ncbi:MAG: methylmalonyl-CoA mutase family protein [Bacteriovoracaceae bacterium]|nr:methylmalonyl-CoA mutase family protein [Bacteriovoracaceae bacterium]
MVKQMTQRLRFVTAASLFDGHDVSINIMRRLLQAKGVEVIHLGHNRSAKEVVDAAIMEDAHAIALSSYQGGHMEYFTYIRQMLNEAGAKDMKIFGGGGGVITPKEIEELHKRGITRIYGPKDGMELGLEGIIDDMITKSKYSTLEHFSPEKSAKDLSYFDLAKVISYIENEKKVPPQQKAKAIPVLGITGTGGAGKSSLIDELLLRFKRYYPSDKIALISVDPTKKKTQGALLGDRIRLGSVGHGQYYVRSLATRDSQNELSPEIKNVISFLKTQDFKLIIVETSGIGQASNEISSIADKSMYVMTPEYGAATQLEKIEMLETADFIVVNKFEKPRGEDALREVRKQYRRNHKMFGEKPSDNELPIYGTMASKFNDLGINNLFKDIAKTFSLPSTSAIEALKIEKSSSLKSTIIPIERMNYLYDISNTVRNYNKKTAELENIIDKYDAYNKASEKIEDKTIAAKLKAEATAIKNEIPEDIWKSLAQFEDLKKSYQSGKYVYQVRDNKNEVETKFTSLSMQKISRIAVPNYSSLKDTLRFVRQENLPGFFPFVAGIFPFKRKDEDPKRMFAGEGGPSRTNERFHFLSANDSFKRLSTAFDSVTLYGEDPAERLDIYGKIGEAGVSICTLDDMDQLYKGFDLTSPNTSVSKTINGPAPIILAMFMNTAINQKLSEKDKDSAAKCLEIIKQVRGTVQADILKEDQAQNTCIFSLEFSLKMMGDVQEYFSRNKIKNYYTVSISGYHIAEAGANPITQLAFTLSNGFTYVEYYLSRGLKIDDFCENLSFFFSNGLDPEYAVIGRVARKIWAVTMKEKYGANEKSQKLKYHIQTSGRSLHAQEIDFNDIRTTLQAFLALSDNCNSLHTNAYDEAITTPTEESVRRAMAIQMIINREFGINKSDNPLQGSYLMQELTDLVESAVLDEFENISRRGGVLGSMESMYQRSKIQEESLYYETLKDKGELPIIGVNTYIAKDIQAQMNREIELTRSTNDEKTHQITRLRDFQKRNKNQSQQALEKLKNVVLDNKNIFEELLQTVKYCSLGEITNMLYEVGGRYRRNM